MATAPLIDLYSDTQTLPTDEMRRAMAGAELGDDTHRADPTVLELEERVAELIDMESAMLVLSGTMANLVALMVHCRPGDEVFMDAGVHLLRSEAGGLTRVAGVVPSIVSSDRGHPTPSGLRGAIQPENVIRPRPRLLWLENTHNLSGGTVLDAAAQSEVVDVAHAYGLTAHLDGARIPNVAAATGQTWAESVSNVDSVYLDFTKGLSCPMGAILAGSTAFIEEARFSRRVLGGGMRQGGVMAAAALVALDTLEGQAAEDNARASLLAKLLRSSEHFCVPDQIDTNMVLVDVSKLGDSHSVHQRLLDRGVTSALRPPKHLRLVTHRHLTDAAIRKAVARLERVAVEMVAERVEPSTK